MGTDIYLWIRYITMRCSKIDIKVDVAIFEDHVIFCFGKLYIGGSILPLRDERSVKGLLLDDSSRLPSSR
jgi:hypothetical protein